MRFAPLLLAVLIASTDAQAQGWRRQFSPPNTRVYDLAPVSDGLVLVGDAGGPALVARLDAGGTVRWSRTVGQAQPQTALAAVATTSDDGIIAVGFVFDPNAGTEALILKLDGNGTVIWQRTWGGPSHDYAEDVATLADGSFVVAGNTDSFGGGGWLGRFDAGGALLWLHRFTETYFDVLRAVVATADGGVFVAGSRSTSPFAANIWAFKVDASGAVQWERQIADGSGLVLSTWNAIATPDGGFAVSGDAPTGPNSASSTSWVVKLDSAGNPQWARSMDEVQNAYFRVPGDMVALPDGSLLFSDWRWAFAPPPFPQPSEGRLWKLDSNGNLVSVIQGMNVGLVLLRKGNNVFVTGRSDTGGSGSTFLLEFDWQTGAGCAGPPTMLSMPVRTMTSSITTTAVTTPGVPPSTSSVPVAAAALTAAVTCGVPPIPPLLSTPGLYDPATSTFHLRNTLSAGPDEIVITFGLGGAGWKPVVGDWNGDGIDTVGVYDPAGATFHLRNSNTTGPANAIFTFGPAGNSWLPIAGDWDGNGSVTIGLYDPASGVWYLRNSLTSGTADVTFAYGPAGAGWRPVVGRWFPSNPATLVGLFDPTGSTFYLAGQNGPAPAAVTLSLGPTGRGGWRPVAGDWDGDGGTTCGLFDQSRAAWFLRNTNNSGYPDLVFTYGPGNWIPLTGDWNGR